MRTRCVEGFEVCSAPKTIFLEENAFSRCVSLDFAQHVRARCHNHQRYLLGHSRVAMHTYLVQFLRATTDVCVLKNWSWRKIEFSQRQRDSAVFPYKRIHI